MINKIALKKFFEQNKEDYYSRRNSGDIKNTTKNINGKSCQN